MFQEIEAQKVIAISLGKIAISRSQRGGPKLFKNLLVANVIQKARYVVLDETAYLYRTRYEQQQPSGDDSRTEQWEVTYSGSLNRDVATESLSLTDDSSVELASNEIHRPPTESRESDAVSAGGMDMGEKCACWDEQNKENVLPIGENAERTTPLCNRNVFTGEKLYYSSTVSLPSRCVKRRNSTTEDMSSTKRARKDWRRSNSDTENESSEDLVGVVLGQTNDTNYRDLMDDEMEQITNLVSVFSSSFKGLVDAPTKAANEMTGFYGEKTRKGGPDVVGAVCSKQAGSVFTMRQSSFETSSPPVLALTV